MLLGKACAGLLHLTKWQQPDQRFMVEINDLDAIYPMDRENRSGKVAVGDRCGRSKVHDLVASRRTLCLRGPLLFHEFYTGEFCHTHCPRNIDAESVTPTLD